MSSTLEDLVTPLSAMHGEMDPMDPHDNHMMYPGGVMVTPTAIITPMENIPRFAANPTITAVRSGDWSDPSVWSMGRVPRAGDRVLIGEHQMIKYDLVSNVRIDSIEISGTLQFQNTVGTRLLVANLTVMPDGHLIVGTREAPIASNVQAELIIADKPINLEQDPRQLGTGLIALGEVTIQGAAKTRTWTRLAAEPLAGARYLWLSEPATNWKAGETIVLPDSRQVPYSQARVFSQGSFPEEWETATIQSVFGQLVILEEPIKFDHRGARNVDGQLELLPHVAVLDRNVLIRSENPNGTRGHTMYTARADVDIGYAQFANLGRTDAFVELDNTLFDANGNAIHFGTNQVGRYAVHFHHLLGPENATNIGFQFEFIGNTVQSSKKWAVAVHATSYGLIERNVVFDAQGSGFVTEDGTEIDNIFASNFAMRVQGTLADGKNGTEDGNYGRGGVGFWFRRGGNYIFNNVATNNNYAGFVFSGYNLKPGRLPLFRGADVHDPLQSRDGVLSPMTSFANNEAYGMSVHGLWGAYFNGNNMLPNQPLTLISGLKLWHVHGRAVWIYHATNVTFDNLLILGDLNARDRNDVGATGLDFEKYEAVDIVIRNSRIEGMYLGIVTPTNDGTRPGIEDPTIIENTVLKNYINIKVQPAQEGFVYVGSVIIVRNVKFTMVANLPNYPKPADSIEPPANILMKLAGDVILYPGTTTVRVYGYNQVPGDDFQVYFYEQAANFILPATPPDVVGIRDRKTLGVPEAGLTNAQAWAKYGLAMGGAVAPSNANPARFGITGLAAAMAPPVNIPRISLITPWENNVSVAGFTRVRYNVIGQVPRGAAVFFKLDDRAPVSSFEDLGFFGVSRGNHTLVAYFGNANGTPIAGLPQTTVRFRKI